MSRRIKKCLQIQPVINKMKAKTKERRLNANTLTKLLAVKKHKKTDTPFRLLAGLTALKPHSTL